MEILYVVGGFGLLWLGLGLLVSFVVWCFLFLWSMATGYGPPWRGRTPPAPYVLYLRPFSSDRPMDNSVEAAGRYLLRAVESLGLTVYCVDGRPASGFRRLTAPWKWHEYVGRLCFDATIILVLPGSSGGMFAEMMAIKECPPMLRKTLFLRTSLDKSPKWFDEELERVVVGLPVAGCSTNIAAQLSIGRKPRGYEEAILPDGWVQLSRFDSTKWGRVERSIRVQADHSSEVAAAVKYAVGWDEWESLLYWSNRLNALIKYEMNEMNVRK